MKNYLLLRAIRIAKKIVKNFDLIIACFMLFVLYVGLISIIPRIEGSIGLKALVTLPVLFTGVYLRGKFTLTRTSDTIKPSNWVYCILYFAIFIASIGYIPEIITISPEHFSNRIIIAVGIAMFLISGDHLLRKMKRIYWKYKSLIEKGKKFDEINQRLENILRGY